MNPFVKNFLNGCLVLVPVVVTLYTIYLVVVTVDGLVPVPVPGLGFLIAVGLITLIGAFASNVVGKRLVGITDRFMVRVPLVKLIYTSLRDFMAALLGDKRSFDRPCMVSLSPDGSARAFGFITREDLSGFGLSDHVAVYFPQSINFAGQLVLFPRARVQPLETDASEILPFIVSGGMAGHIGSAG